MRFLEILATIPSSFALSVRESNLHTVAQHNADPRASFAMSPNSPYINTSWDTFKSTILMKPQECSATMTGRRGFLGDVSADDLPDSFDWRDTEGVVSIVKDQGNCGSCYSFSSTGALEAHHSIKYGARKTSLLSEQQVIDCAHDFDNHGCDGGLPSHVFEYVHHNNGLDTEAAYPYKARAGSCHFDRASVGVHTKNSFNVTEGDEESIKRIVATAGPVSVAFEVVDDFMLYGGGVYSSSKCRQGVTDVNHAVLVVGYGTDPKQGPYWIVKNSWGPNWGEKGYFRIARGKNMCGIAICASYPILDADEPSEGMVEIEVV